MRVTTLIFFLSLRILAQSPFLLLMDDNTLVYDGTELITTEINRTMEGSVIYASNFSAGVDGWAGVRTTLSGNNDDISDGSITKSDVLKYYADAVNNTHVAYKSLSQEVGKAYKLTFNYYIPSANSTAKKINVANSIFGGTLINGSAGGASTTTGAWTQLSVAYLFAGTALTWFSQLTDLGATTFVGANSASDDITYLKDVSFSSIPIYLSSGNHIADTSLVYKTGGNTSLKITASAAGNGTTNTISLASTLFTAVTDGLNYRFQVYAYTSTANTTLTFKLGDIVLTNIVPTSGMSVLNFDFKATASSTGNILLYLDKAATVYLDDISLKSGQ